MQHPVLLHLCRHLHERLRIHSVQALQSLKLTSAQLAGTVRTSVISWIELLRGCGTGAPAQHRSCPTRAASLKLRHSFAMLWSELLI